MFFMIHKFLMAHEMGLIDDWGNLSTTYTWNFYNSFIFSITVVTTLGYGHIVPLTDSGKIFCLFYALFGIPMTGLLFGAIGTLFTNCLTTPINKTRKQNESHMNARSVLLYIVNATIFFFLGFIIFFITPSIIFLHVEKWSFLEGFYYTFVTLTTIGFGDYVAGKYQKSTKTYF